MSVRAGCGIDPGSGAVHFRRRKLMSRLADHVKRHQIAAFFIITFAITWGLGFSYDAMSDPDKIFLIPLAFVATCGPALAGIIVTRLSCAQPPSFMPPGIALWSCCLLRSPRFGISTQTLCLWSFSS